MMIVCIVSCIDVTLPGWSAGLAFALGAEILMLMQGPLRHYSAVLQLPFYQWPNASCICHQASLSGNASMIISSPSSDSLYW